MIEQQTSDKGRPRLCTTVSFLMHKHASERFTVCRLPSLKLAFGVDVDGHSTNQEDAQSTGS